MVRMFELLTSAAIVLSSDDSSILAVMGDMTTSVFTNVDEKISPTLIEAQFKF